MEAQPNTDPTPAPAGANPAARRMLALAAVAVLVAIGGVFAAAGNWYEAVIPASTVITSPTAPAVTITETRATITGMGLVDQAQITPRNGLPMAYDIADVAGLPRTVFLLLVAALLGLLVAAWRSTFAGVAALGALWFAWRDFGTMQSIMEAGVAGTFNHRLDALSWYNVALVALVGTITMLTLFCARYNHLDRQARKANGEQVHSLLEVAGSMASVMVMRGMEQAKARSERETVSTGSSTSP
jgi:hypothetical protein